MGLSKISLSSLSMVRMSLSVKKYFDVSCTSWGGALCLVYIMSGKIVLCASLCLWCCCRSLSYSWFWLLHFCIEKIGCIFFVGLKMGTFGSDLYSPDHFIINLLYFLDDGVIMLHFTTSNIFFQLHSCICNFHSLNS